MAKQLRLRRGNTLEHSNFTGASGELTYDTQRNTIIIHDGSTAGGSVIAKQANVDILQNTINTTVVLKTANVGAAYLPTGTTAERPDPAANGMLRFNVSTNRFEGFKANSWGAIGGGATGGGNDEIFVENGKTVNSNYTVAADKNAVSGGPITINGGVTVTVLGDWTIV